MKQYAVKAVTHDGRTLYSDPTTKDEALIKMGRYIERNTFKSVTLVYREVSDWKEVKK